MPDSVVLIAGPKQLGPGWVAARGSFGAAGLAERPGTTSPIRPAQLANSRNGIRTKTTVDRGGAGADREAPQTGADPWIWLIVGKRQVAGAC
jgi:hypothetical protein